MEQFLGVLAGLNLVSLGAGFAAGTIFGGKVRRVLAAGLEKLAGWLK
jgi:hypothetical protein